jgi:bifunctional UDP-N-acetylglucosamine pyrophosphorylase / glucosamine-1-phosphate N-acetyltransferase
MKWDAIVLAAGDGTRMLSNTPKVLHQVAGLPMIERTIRSLNHAGVQKIHLVISTKIKNNLQYLNKKFSNIEFHIQASPLGTADAVKSVHSKLSESVLICNGDHPLVNSKDISDLVNTSLNSKSKMTVAYLELEPPNAFGRLITNSKGELSEIIEAKHATEEQLKIKKINTGLYFVNSELLFKFLKSDFRSEGSKEFYLTDCIKYLVEKEKMSVSSFKTTSDMAFGVNDSLALAQANQRAYELKALDLISKGVRFLNPNSVYIEEDVQIESDVLVYPNVYISGNSVIKTGTVLEHGVVIKNSHIGEHTVVKAGTYIEGANVIGHSSLGPYAHLREGSEIHKNVKVGNFAEIKNSVLKDGVKAGHQCYLGDAVIGEGTNIGAGTITCNFAVDGKKYKTEIGKNVFVGSDTQIVPPIKIGDNSVLAAGSTVTKDVEEKSLYVTRAKAVVKQNYRK